MGTIPSPYRKVGTHSRGGHTVTIAEDGAIVVRPGDSVSKYSMAIHGDFNHLNEYGRKNRTSGAFEPLENINLITSGETIYHLPTAQIVDIFYPEPPKPSLEKNTLSSMLQNLAGVTAWRIKGTSGASAEFGTPVVEVSIGASYLRIPFENTLTGEEFLLQGVGVGAGLGFSLDSPFDISVTTDGMWGKGSNVAYAIGGNILMKKSDFQGHALIFTGSGSVGGQGNYGFIAFMKSPVLPGPIPLPIPVPPIILKAMAAFIGPGASSSVGVGVTAYQYYCTPMLPDPFAG